MKNILNEMIKIASALDDFGMYDEATEIDNIVKEAQISNAINWGKRVFNPENIETAKKMYEVGEGVAKPMGYGTMAAEAIERTKGGTHGEAAPHGKAAPHGEGKPMSWGKSMVAPAAELVAGGVPLAARVKAGKETIETGNLVRDTGTLAGQAFKKVAPKLANPAAEALARVPEVAGRLIGPGAKVLAPAGKAVSVVGKAAGPAAVAAEVGLGMLDTYHTWKDMAQGKDPSKTQTYSAAGTTGKWLGNAAGTLAGGGWGADKKIQQNNQAVANMQRVRASQPALAKKLMEQYRGNPQMMNQAFAQVAVKLPNMQVAKGTQPQQQNKIVPQQQNRMPQQQQQQQRPMTAQQIPGATTGTVQVPQRKA